MNVDCLSQFCMWVTKCLQSVSSSRDCTGVCFCHVVLYGVVTHTPDLPSSVANRTVNQANVAGETAVAGANEMSQATVEGVENVAAATGMMNPVGGASQSRPALMQQIIILHCSFSRELLGLEQQTFHTINKNHRAFHPDAFTLNGYSTQWFKGPTFLPSLLQCSNFDYAQKLL